jgi:hypothetical protein
MQLKVCVVKRFLGMWAGPIAVGAVLVAGSPSMAAEDARFIPAKRPVKTTAVPVAAPTAAATPEKAALKSAEPCPADDTATQSGMRAFIDPATGQLREPTAEEAAELSRAGERRALARVAPQVVQRPGGMISAQLGDEYMNDVVVRKNADGTLVFKCVPHSDGDKALAAPVRPAKSELETE